LILIGLLKKVVIADYLAVNLVDRVFDFPDRFSSLEVLAAIYGYAIQIYCDFSGYSDIAIGSALLLGLHIPQNFDRPYQAANLRDFWRRWHISLSTWLRDYLYIPLGGSRQGPWRTYLALAATMLLGGLWHGASWTFVLWGALHGLALALTRGYQRLLGGPLPSWTRPIAIFLTFHFVCFCWVIFRSPSLDWAGVVLRQIGNGELSSPNLTPPVLLGLALGLITHVTPRDFVDRLFRTFVSLSPAMQAALALLVVVIVHLVDVSDVQPFIYFQF
jgi:D-alanyl-lipoteichoic acid acyltransferase DltB (MBOAT superfamily)